MSKSDTFRMMTDPAFQTHTFNGKTLVVGFVPDDAIGAGYCDGEVIWVQPGMHLERAIEVAIHEGIHACFPKVGEKEVDQCGRDIASFVMRVLQSTRDDFHPQGKAPVNPDAVYAFLVHEKHGRTETV